MKEAKAQKGITLIALVITIIVLLILAGVSIATLTGENGILTQANNAKNKTKEAQEEEAMLQNYLDILNEKTENSEETTAKWTQEGVTLTRTNADGTKTQIKIGDYVNYNEGSYTHTPDTAKGAGTSQTGGSNTEGWTLGTSELTTQDLKWRVLGLNEKGQLELISETPTTQTLYLANDEGYVNAEDNLKNFCNDLYGQGTNSEGKKVATGARSLNVDDINKLTKYDPKTDSGYGIICTFRYPTTDEVDGTRYMQYSKDGGTTWTNLTGSNHQTFRLPNEETAISSSNPGSKEVEYTFYGYVIPDELTTEDGYTEDEVTDIIKILIGEYSFNEEDYFWEYEFSYCWLGSKCVYDAWNRSSFAIRTISYCVDMSSLFYSDEWFYCFNYSVRPVVCLSSDVSLTGSGEDIGSADNMWNIS